MSSRKIPLGCHVLDAAQKRLLWTFNTFPRICLSFSGGKDSTVMFHLTAACARQLKRRFHVLFIDWEAQFSHTLRHVEVMKKDYNAAVINDRARKNRRRQPDQNPVASLQPLQRRAGRLPVVGAD